jgi:hypothetical protein
MDPDQVTGSRFERIYYRKGRIHLFSEESGSAYFGAKMMPCCEVWVN